jgi:hypothetical protein
MSRLPWDMTGKVVVITGGDVVIWGRRREKNEEAAASLREFGTKSGPRRSMSRMRAV